MNDSSASVFPTEDLHNCLEMRLLITCDHYHVHAYWLNSCGLHNLGVDMH